MLNIGLTNRRQLKVDCTNTASALKSGLLDVFSTPSMIALMEHTCAECVQPFLEKNEGSVGISVNVKHLSATPIGETVTCDCCLTEIDRKRLVFAVKCMDENGLIGEGVHERLVIDNQRFMDKLKEKTKKS